MSRLVCRLMEDLLDLDRRPKRLDPRLEAKLAQLRLKASSPDLILFLPPNRLWDSPLLLQDWDRMTSSKVGVSYFEVYLSNLPIRRQEPPLQVRLQDLMPPFPLQMLHLVI
jgi:hypothetical protein